MSLQPKRNEGVMAFMPFYFERFCWTTRGWPTDARWAYLILLCEQYTTGHLPADPKVLERLSPGTMEHWALIEPKIPIEQDGLRRNERCTEHREKSLGIAKARREAARIAALAKHGRSNNAAQPDASGVRDGCATDASRTQSGSGSETGSGSVIGSAERSETHTLNGVAVEPVSSVNDPKPSRAEARPRIGTDADFKAFWDIYPRRVGKGAARAAFFKALPLLADEMELIEEAAARHMIQAVEAYASKPETRALEQKFIPHPVTWLNQRRYIDELEAIRKAIFR
jgi:uncharacterized protein YdaU (DUF1376 family)